MHKLLQFLLPNPPVWLQSNYPILRYELNRQSVPVSWVYRVVTLIGWGLFGIFLLLVAYFGLMLLQPQQIAIPLTSEVWRLLFYPLIFLQLMTRIVAVIRGVGVIHDERRRQTWDNLRATEQGIQHGLWTYLIATLHRLRGLLWLILSARILLLLAMLYELTSIEGAYIAIIYQNAQPPMPVFFALLLHAALMTAFMLLPMLSIAVDITLGLLIGVALSNKTLSLIAQVLLSVLRVFSVLGFGWLLFQSLGNQFVLLDWQQLIVYGAFSIWGDWGLFLGRLDQLSDAVAQVPFAVFLPIMLLVWGIFQAVFIHACMKLAIKLADRGD